MNFSRSGSTKEESSHGPDGTSCRNAGAGGCQNAVRHSLSSSRRRRGNPAGVSRGAEAAGGVLKVDKWKGETDFVSRSYVTPLENATLEKVDPRAEKIELDLYGRERMPTSRAEERGRDGC